jgi:hypothetical protein
MSVQPLPSEPVPALAGTFALYEDGVGGFVLVTDVGGEVTRKHIPGALVKMALGDNPISKRVRTIMGG